VSIWRIAGIFKGNIFGVIALEFLLMYLCKDRVRMRIRNSKKKASG
jgi:hypothetical protein